VDSGDKHVRFIAGKTMLEEVKDTALADNIHPGDSGFVAMASHIGAALKEMIGARNEN
jgi:precorrin-3B methylase